MIKKDSVDRNTESQVNSLNEVTTRVIFMVKIAYLSGRTKENNYYRHIGLQNMKVGEKTNFGRLARRFQICSMDVDILS